MQALYTATLYMDDDGCVQGRMPGGGQSTIGWPKRSTVSGDSDEFEIKDPDGKVLARSDESISIAGGLLPRKDAAAWGNVDCAQGDSLWHAGPRVPESTG